MAACHSQLEGQVFQGWTRQATSSQFLLGNLLSGPAHGPCWSPGIRYTPGKGFPGDRYARKATSSQVLLQQAQEQVMCMWYMSKLTVSPSLLSQLGRLALTSASCRQA